ncbi:YbjN domain-containing protein [Serratia marcescens]|uniref:YbjN domain-containing protein n=1 Tax=Serratia marcescens TaxID=615 RepID=UPI0013DA73DA|nr:YbjN domain-containing protein [Serratia marcescens]
MCKPEIRYIADFHTIEKHEEALRVAALSAAQTKIISTLLACYPNKMDHAEFSAMVQLIKSLADNVDDFLKEERERFDNNSEVRHA